MTRPRTAHDYRHKMERHVIPRLGGLKLSGLQTGHLQRLYRELLDNGRLDGKGGLSPRTVQLLHRIVSEALKHAARAGLITHNPAQDVTLPRVSRPEIRTLTPEQAQRVFDAVQEPYRTAIHLLLFVGLRRSEALGLWWSDVSLDHGQGKIRVKPRAP